MRSSDFSIPVGSFSKGAGRSLHPTTPRITWPSAGSPPRRSAAPGTCLLSDRHREWAYRAPVPPNAENLNHALQKAGGTNTRLLDIEPWRDPDILNVEHQAQQHLDRQADHGQEKDHQDGVLQQALALIIFRVVTPIQRVHQEAADGEEATNDRRTEDGFAQVGRDAENVRQIAVDLVDLAVVIPGLPGPEPLPAWATNEGADGDHRYPENDEAEEERANFELPLLPGVIAGAKRIGIDVWNDHQAENDKRRHDDASNPRVKVNQHFLKAQEIPRCFRGIHRQVRICGLLERRIQSDGPDHQDDGDDDGGQEFDTKEERPYVDFFLPAGLEGPGFAVVRFS